MAGIDDLVAAFFVNVGDVVAAASEADGAERAITAATRPQTDPGGRTTHLIDGQNYFGALRTEIANLLAGGSDRFFYTTSWHFGLSHLPELVQIGEGSFTSAWQANARDGLSELPAFQLDDSSGGTFHAFSDDLVQLVAAGVDVRILAWATPFLVNFEQASREARQHWATNIHSLRSATDLRQRAGMDDRVVLNTIGHTLGAMHLKMVVCGDSTGFRGYTSGMDFAANRISKTVHEPGWMQNFWHDVAIRVEGTAAAGLYGTFQQQWNEQVKRSPKTFKAFGSEIKTHVDDTPLIDGRDPVPITGGTQHTQVLRTVPTMNFAFFKTDRAPLSCYERLISGFKQQKLSYAPDGIYEFRAAQRKAVGAAQRYIYIEDQAFENLELASWINLRLKAVPALKMILLYMGDPVDGPSMMLPDLMDRLVDGVTTPAERIVFGVAPYTIHTKMTIIDDLWVSIGSSNCMRRSFYMDGEISVSVLDDVAPGTPAFAARVRKDVWGEHCGVSPGPNCDPLLALDDALGIWRTGWGTPPDPFKLRADIARKKVPFAFVPAPVPTDSFPAPRQVPSLQARDIGDGDSRLEY
jgi:phosphatidylserine/phosphatidylglycerophosphate/cardiolipin synthase-like enzyme